MQLFDSLRSSFYEKYKKIEISEHRLLYLFLEITKRCNMACLHCGTDCKTTPDSPELTTESWFKIIDYFVENYSSQLVFVITGGEPLVHRDLIEIGKYITRKKRRWGMVTNGMLLDEQKFEQLTQAGIYSLTISFDGLKESCNTLRNSSSAFKKVMSAIDLIGQSNIKFKDAVTCVYSKNINELDEIAEILYQKRMNSWRLFRVFLSGRAKQNPVTQLSFEQTHEMMKKIAELRKKYRPLGLNINYSCEGWMPYSIDKTIRDAPFFCRAGINTASVLADGNITGCSNNHSDFYRGNILNDSFAEVWNNRFDDFRNRKWLQNTICARCEYKEKCQGSSIHLWDLHSDKPTFCYMKNLELIE